MISGCSTVVDMERRSEETQVPDSPNEVLNQSQLLTLSNLERFGWMLAFIRKPLFQDTVPVLFHPDTKKIGTLNGDGAFNIKPDIKFR